MCNLFDFFHRMEKKAAFVLNNESKCEPRYSETTYAGSAL